MFLKQMRYGTLFYNNCLRVCVPAKRDSIGFESRGKWKVADVWHYR